MSMKIRIARPVSALRRSATMYVEALGFVELGRFEDHAGFDGIILGKPEENWHFEFTYCRHHPVSPTPTPEDLLVFYVPAKKEWLEMCNGLLHAGFVETEAYNPYWQVSGRTFEDPDGYRVVVQMSSWTAS